MFSLIKITYDRPIPTSDGNMETVKRGWCHRWQSRETSLVTHTVARPQPRKPNKQGSNIFVDINHPRTTVSSHFVNCVVTHCIKISLLF